MILIRCMDEMMVVSVSDIASRGGALHNAPVLPPATGVKILTQQISMLDPLTTPKIWP